MELELAREQFVHQVQRALSSLYDPAVLSNSLLVKVFSIDEQRDPVTALRRILTGAIESLKPNEPVPPGSRGWRVYQVLRRRYTEQLTQHEVALDLGLSIRQLQREEKMAREVLADRLWATYNLDAKASLLVPAGQPDGTMTANDSPAPSAAQELESLSGSTQAQVVEIGAVVHEVLDTLRPLLSASHTSAWYEEDASVLPVFVKVPMLRQALLNIATVAVQHASEGSLFLHAYHDAAHLCVDLQALCPGGAATADPIEWSETLEMARQMLHFCHGSLQVMSLGGAERADTRSNGVPTFAARVELQAAEVFSVLVVDDNADTRQLLQRYLHGTPYQFIGAQDAQQALALAQQITPKAIILDVMMPRQDGWTLLGQLREHPRLRGVPIIVSTILPQKELAFALGAAEFIRKPIKRPELLAALARHLGSPTESGS
ncbi:MAG: response regulator [Chloroflexi bacterium]|nr:response regulator [Chloroflexota bacterium]